MANGDYQKDTRDVELIFESLWAFQTKQVGDVHETTAPKAVQLAVNRLSASGTINGAITAYRLYSFLMTALGETGQKTVMEQIVAIDAALIERQKQNRGEMQVESIEPVEQKQIEEGKIDGQEVS